MLITTSSNKAVTSPPGILWLSSKTATFTPSELLPECPPCGEVIVCKSNSPYVPEFYLVRVDGHRYEPAPLIPTNMIPTSIDIIGHRLKFTLSYSLKNGVSCTVSDDVQVCTHKQNVVVASYHTSVAHRTYGDTWLRLSRIGLHPTERYVDLFYEKLRKQKMTTCLIAMIDDTVIVCEGRGQYITIVNTRSGEEIETTWNSTWLYHTLSMGHLADKIVALPSHRLFFILVCGKLVSYNIDTNVFRMEGVNIIAISDDGRIDWEPPYDVMKRHAPTILVPTEGKIVCRASFGTNGRWSEDINCYVNEDVPSVQAMSNTHVGGLINGNVFILRQHLDGSVLERKLEESKTPFSVSDRASWPDFLDPVFFRRCVQLLQLVEEAMCHPPSNFVGEKAKIHANNTSLRLPDDTVIINTTSLVSDDRNLNTMVCLSQQERSWTITCAQPFSHKLYVVPIHSHLLSRYYLSSFPELLPPVLVLIILEYAII